MVEREIQSSPTTIVYDGSCHFCLKSISVIQDKDRDQVFEYLTFQDPSLAPRFPQLKGADMEEGMRLVLPNGETYAGMDAVYQIASRLPGFRRFAWLYRLPLGKKLGRKIYGLIAKNRMKISERYCNEDGACKLPHPSQPPKRPH